MYVPGCIPVLAWVNTPVAVPPSAAQLSVGAAVVPQQVPRAVMLAPPLEVMLAPKVAPEPVIEVAVGEVTVGALRVFTVNPLVRVPVWVSGLVTTTFQVPVAAPVMGQVPDDNVVELVKVNPVQLMAVWPDLVRETVAPDT